MSTPLPEIGKFGLTDGVSDALFNSHTVENISPRDLRGYRRAGNTS